jgi:hypothetical protein
MTLIIQKPTGAKLNLAKTFTWNESIWNPSMITTALWLDAADSRTLFTTNTGNTLVTSGETVGRWNDKSGNSRNISQAASSNRPTYSGTSYNGRPGITFDASNDILAASTAWWLSAIGSGAFHAFHVMEPSSSSSFGVSVTGADGSGAIPRLYMISVNYSYSTNETIIFSPSLSQGIAEYGHDGNTTAFARLNGGTQATATQAAIAPSGGFYVIPFKAGGTQQPGISAEHVVVSGSLSTLNRQKIEGYLAHKWGLTANLPSDHPYKTVGPTP